MQKTHTYLLLIMVFVFLSGCEKQAPTSTQTQTGKTQNQANETNQQPEPATPQERKVWPYDGENKEEEPELAKNLLAKNYILIFDGSGSMNERECSAGKKKIEVARQAVAQWSSTLPDDANLSLVAFHNNGWVELPPVAGERANFIRAVDKIVAGGRTPLSQAIGKAYNIFGTQGKKQLGYGEFTMVIVTDGIANSPDTLSKYVNYIIENTPINIYSIGFCIGSDHSLNQRGKTEYKAADNPEQLRQGLKEVLAESESFDVLDFD